MRAIIEDSSTWLKQRSSQAKLTEPGPDAGLRQSMLAAADRAPDHGRLKPWSFIWVDGHERQQLGELFVQAALAEEPDLPLAQQERFRTMSLRAPSILIGLAKPVAHPKVPRLEQLISSGLALHQAALVANLNGIGSYWRTGPLARSPLLKAALGLAERDEIIGFLYLGTVTEDAKITLGEADRPGCSSSLSACLRK